MTEAGLAVKESDGTTDFCDRRDTSGRTDGSETCIREMRMSSALHRRQKFLNPKGRTR